MQMRKNITKICLILCIFLITSGCEKGSINSNVFSAYFKNKNYEILDLSSQYREIKGVSNVFVAKKSDYQIEYFVFDDSSSALNSARQNYDIFISMNLKGKKNQGDNFFKFSFSNSAYYVVISQIENTVIYAQVPLAYQNEVDNYLKEINY